MYTISYKKFNSQFHRALKISYPNEKDKANARKKGVKTGDFLMVHGLGPSFAWLGSLHTKHDWTLGCVAVTNEEIDEIYAATVVGTKIELLP